MDRWRTAVTGTILALAALGSSISASAQSVADFYRGKTLSMVIATSPGGDYDLRARLIAGHMSRHIPGEPTVKDPAFLAEAEKANVDISASTGEEAQKFSDLIANTPPT